MARNKFDIDETLERDAEFNIKHLLRLKQYIAPYKKPLLLTVLAMLAASFVGMLGPMIIAYTIDYAIPQKSIPMVIGLAAAMCGIVFLNAVFLRYRVAHMSRVGQGIIRDLRKHLFTHIQALPFTYFDSRPHGKILVRVVNYVNSLSDLLSNGIVNLLTDLFSLVVIVCFMVALDVRMTLASMAGLPFLFLAAALIKVKQRKAWRINSAKQSNMTAYIHESTAGMKVTQAFVREDWNKNVLNKLTHVVKKSWMDAVRVMFLMGPAADIIANLTYCLIYVCGVLWLSGTSVGADGVAGMITLGTLTAFISYAGRFWGPISNIANLYNQIVVNMTYLERIFEAIDEPTVVDDIEGATILPPIKGRVTFDDVTFAYDESKVILKNVSFDIQPGQTVALVGPTGAGKTTVVNLISRFYDLNGGQIRLDGTDIHGVTLHSLRSQMGIMLQDSFIFSGTIMDNIRYGRLDATDEEVMSAAKTVCAHDFISEMEKGYMTEVNERGSQLSVGQRQLISFARALLADPKVLILDEATSSIDTQTEKLLQEGLNRLLAGRTSFIIAHRLSTIQNADKIMYIDQGKVLESGTHDELLAQKGAYYELHEAQYSFL